jgi:hypothetical protein
MAEATNDDTLPPGFSYMDPPSWMRPAQVEQQNSQAEADLMLASYQANKATIIRSLRRKISYLEARLHPTDRRLRRSDYEGLYRLHQRIAKLESDLRKCN